MKFLVYVLIFGFLLGNVTNAGTTGKIAGVIKDKNSGEALIGANVLVIGTSFGSTTDLHGHYYILNVPPGTFKVSASYMGYQKLTYTEVKVNIDQTTLINFELEPQAINVEEVLVIAEKPPVELDRTSSKQSVTSSEISRSWGLDVKDIISDLPGLNINGGIRGGFGLDVAYNLDGMDMREIGSNTNFTGINTTTIQEIELLTGGWNAEYGQANGAIVNIVSKNATDRIHAIYSYKFRPAGEYHWGDNIYSQSDVFHTIATTPDFWDPNKKWQTQWMPTEHAGYNGGTLPFSNMTPEDRAAWWKNFINDPNYNPQINYANRFEWENEITIYGPLSIKDLGFMLSIRYKEGAGIYPSALKYNPDYTIQGNLNYKFGSSKIELNGIYNKFTNSQVPRSNYGSTEDTFNSNEVLPYVSDPYSSGNGNGRYTYWFWGVTSSSFSQNRPPGYADLLNVQAKLTHVFSQSTFLEVALQHSESKYESNFFDFYRASIYGSDGQYQNAYLPSYGLFSGNYSSLPTAFWNFYYDRPGDIWDNKITSVSNVFKVDWTNQITQNHLIKAGAIFSYNIFDKILHDHQSSGTLYFAQVTDLSETKSHPYEGAFYIQDKIEYEGLVVNAGVRLDFFNANKNVSANVFDPLLISDASTGHIGEIGHISYDPDGSGAGYKRTPFQFAFSPRIGISHPITENTVLHFNYGKFNQRPPWQKIVAPPVVRTPAPSGLSDWSKMDPDTLLVYYNFFTHFNANPGLTYEKMTQYEIGIDQNIADMFQLNVTLYYKDAYDLTSEGIYRGYHDNFNITEGSAVTARLYGDPRDPEGRESGKTQGYFETSVNGAWANVRGLEITLNTKFKYFNARLNYTYSILSRGTNYMDIIYKQFPDTILGINHYSGASNTDGGGVGMDDQAWNPHGSANIKLFLTTPSEFGPELGGFFIFGDWDLSTSTTWAQGQSYTYHRPNDISTEPNNRIWRDRWNTNLSLGRRIRLFNTFSAKFFIQVQNLFNDQQLRLLPENSTSMSNYQELGVLPYESTTYQPLVWDWYLNNPREIYFGFEIEY